MVSWCPFRRAATRDDDEAGVRVRHGGGSRHVEATVQTRHGRRRARHSNADKRRTREANLNLGVLGNNVRASRRHRHRRGVACKIRRERQRPRAHRARGDLQYGRGAVVNHASINFFRPCLCGAIHAVQ